jgi:hypothetical protein
MADYGLLGFSYCRCCYLYLCYLVVYLLVLASSSFCGIFFFLWHLGFKMLAEPDFLPGRTYFEFKKEQREEERPAWVQKIIDSGPWVSFLTLTFDNRADVIPEQADKRWKYFVQCLNRDILGQHYVNKVGHSYFGYVRGLEYQQRGVVHFHALVDRCLDFEIAHRMWKHMAGYLWISKINDSEAAVHYVTKYCTKGGEIDFYKPQKPWEFRPTPPWERLPVVEKQPEYLQLDFLE